MTSFEAIATVMGRISQFCQIACRIAMPDADLSSTRRMCFMGNHRQLGSFARGRSQVLLRGSCCMQ